jgi:regulator of replication initiation timing
MYQAHAQKLLNQKESETGSYMQENIDPTLDKATHRLLNALERLERNLQHVTVQQDRGIQQEQQLMTYIRENDVLKSERDKLMQSIGQLEEQYAELQKVATTVYDKLDASIDRINQIIEN